MTPAPAIATSSPRPAPTEQSLYRRNAACKHVRSGGQGGLRLVGTVHASTSPTAPPTPPTEGNASREDAPFKTMTQGCRGNEKGGRTGRRKERERGNLG